ncbi:MAG: hypothetical protein H6862_03950 [Rhodospirillales bacterium]|nr:hypothetical protein [Rhodospirillales bacterium]
MSGSKALFGGLALIAAAIVFSGFSPVMGQSRGGDSFQISSESDLFVWRVNQATGEVSFCTRNNDSRSSSLVSSSSPFCSGSSPAVR